ncbi:MAG: PAS domain-containing sensor histidine kinase [Verrucomicrobiota bacterium]
MPDRTAAPLSESHALHNTLIQQLPVGIFRKDAEGRYVLVNAEFCRLQGRKADHFLGRTPREIANHEPVTTVQLRRRKEIHFLQMGADHHEHIMRTGQTIELEEQYPTEDGAGQFFHVLKSPVFDANGKVIGSQGILMDLTERKRAEAELNHERNLLHALMEKSDDLIYFKDLESRFLRASAKFALLFNVGSAADLSGRSDADFFAPEHAREALADEQNIIRTGKAMLGKTEKESWPDGHVTWALTSKWPLRNAAGEIIGTFGISKDVTAIKEGDAKLERMHQQLMDASLQAGMAEVATSVLHNVGNVLNSVNVSCSLIAETFQNSKAGNLAKAVALMRAHETDLGDFLAHDPKGKQLLDYLGNLAVNLERDRGDSLREVGALVDNITHIKEIVTMQQGYVKALGVVESVQVADLVEDAIRMNGSAMVRHQVHVVREFAEVPLIQAEKHKILQVLVNLIRNAKYACDESGRPDKQVTLRVTAGNNRVNIQVIDNGVGIPPENLTRIFNHGFTTRKDGHGFGLHTSAIAARELGGQLSVISAGVGQGAAFTLELPLAKSQPVL